MASLELVRVVRVGKIRCVGEGSLYMRKFVDSADEGHRCHLDLNGTRLMHFSLEFPISPTCFFSPGGGGLKLDLASVTADIGADGETPTAHESFE